MLFVVKIPTNLAFSTENRQLAAKLSCISNLFLIEKQKTDICGVEKHKR